MIQVDAACRAQAEDDHLPTGTWGDHAVLALAALGFLSLCVQTILLRELFCVLAGSDLAFAFALASWTSLTALGALSERFLRPLSRLARSIGLPVFMLSVAIVFLLLRRWGAEDVVPFHEYVRIPVYLGVPCFIGGLLFPLFLRGEFPVMVRVGYAAEVLGCLAAGLFCAVYFRLGGVPAPLLLALLVQALILFGPLAPRLSRVAFWGVFLVALLVPLVPGLEVLEHASLRLHFRRGVVVDAASTPHGAMVAVRDADGRTAVFENGLPWPATSESYQDEALLAILLALPEDMRTMLLVNGLRHGLGVVVGRLGTPAEVTFMESDREALAFAGRHVRGTEPPRTGSGVLDIRRRHLPGSCDIVALLSSPPTGLESNHLLTAEFFRSIRPCLALGGVLAVVLPVAPGFIHPEQERYLDTVRSALQDVFRHCRSLRTHMGWLILMGGDRSVNLDAAAARLTQRCPALPTDALAEATLVLQESGEVAIETLALPPGESPADLPAARAGANHIAFPRAYFGYLQFRGLLIDDVPRVWRAIFCERPLLIGLAVVTVLLATGSLPRRNRRLQPVFWCSWCGALSLVAAIDLYQSIVGQVYWALPLLSAAAIAGIFTGTLGVLIPTGSHWRYAAVTVPVLLFPLWRLWVGLPETVVLPLLVSALGLAGAASGRTFALASERGRGLPVSGGMLYALDLLGSAGGVFVGGVLFVWWHGFTVAAWLSVAAALLALGLERR